MKGGVDEYRYIPNIMGDEFPNMFKALANHYMRRFCKRNDLNYDMAWWEGDEPGTKAYFEKGLALTFDELRFAVENQIPLKIVAKWSYYNRRTLEAEEGIRMTEKFTTLEKVSLEEWCKGKELPYTFRELRKLHEKAKRHRLKYDRLQDKNKGRV